jgi:hypothetical protein
MLDWSIWQVKYSRSTCLHIQYVTTCEGGTFGSLELRDSRGLECSVIGKSEDLKAKATWSDLEILRDFETPGLGRICVQSGKEAFNTEVSSVKLSSCLSIQWGMNPGVGLDGEWTFHHGCRNLEMVHVRRILMGAMWPLTNEARITSEGHNFRSRAQIGVRKQWLEIF